MDTNASKELFEYAKEAFLEQVRIDDLVEVKALRYLTVLTVVLGVAAFFTNHVLSTAIPPSSGLDWLLVIVGAILLIGLLVASFQIIRLLGTGGLRTLPLNSAVVESFLTNSPNELFISAADKMREGHEENVARTERKSRILARAHRILKSVFVAFAIYVFLIAAHLWTR
jgi:hypothetical protein